VAAEPSLEQALAEIAELRARVTDLEHRGGHTQRPAPFPPPAAPLRHAAPDEPSHHPLLTPEYWNGTRLFAILGGLLVVVGAVFLVTLAIGNGWITPRLQVVGAIVGGSLLTAAGVRLRQPGDAPRAVLAQALAGTGGAVAFLGIIAGSRLYDDRLFPYWVGLGLGAAVAASVALLAIRWRAQLLAAFGIVAAIVSPALVDAPENSATTAFLVVALAAAAAVVVVAGWPWLVQAATWTSWIEVGNDLANAPRTWPHALYAALWWALVISGALAHDLRRPTGRLRVSTAISTFTSAGLSCVLAAVAAEGDTTAVGIYAVCLGLTYFGLAAVVRALQRQKPTSLWLALVGATFGGVGVSMLLGGSRPTEIGGVWCVEGLAFGWLGRREDDTFAFWTGVAALGVSAIVLLTQAPPNALLYGAGSLPTFIAAAAIMTTAGVIVSRVWAPAAPVAAGLALYGVSGVIVTAIGGERPDYSHAISQPAQVTLSLVWVGVGVTVLGVALSRHSPVIRRAGMSLVVLAAAKALLIDMAALSSGARVLALVGVGLVLFLASYLLARFERARVR